MFKKLGRGLSFKSGGKSASKFRFDVHIDKLENLPGPVKKCRVVWSRGPKLQMTEIKEVKNGTAVYKQTLSQVATMYKDAKEAYEPKEYNFKVQVPGKGGDDKMITVGKADLDLSKFVVFEGKVQPKLIPIMFKVGATTTGYLKVAVTAELLQSNVDDDGMTEVSGMTGLTSSMDTVEQDLSGFEEEVAPKPSSPTPPARTSSGASQPTSRFADKSKDAGSRPAAAAAAAAPAGPSTSRLGVQRPPPKAVNAAEADEDGDVSPMDLSPESSFGEAPPAASAKAGFKTTIARNARPAAAAGSDDDEVNWASFSGGGSKQGKAPEKTEAELRAELFGLPAKPSTAAPAKASAATTGGHAAKAAAPAAAAARTPAPVADSTPKRPALFDRPDRQSKAAAKSAAEAPISPPDSPPPPTASTKAASAKVVAAKQASAAIAAAVVSSSGSDELREEVERLRAQLAAFKELGGSAEEVRRAARQREERLAAERDEYQQQVAELEERLKEAWTSHQQSHASQEELDALQEKLAAVEVERRSLDSERTVLLKRLAEEQEEKAELEEQLKQQLEDGGDDVAQQTVAAYEAKYNRLKGRYRELQESSREEVDVLHDELHEAHERIAQLEQLAAQLEALRSEADQGQAVLAKTMQHNSKIGTDLADLQRENEALMQQLVQTKLELAQLSEREIISRREVYKAKETNMKLASKMTKLETLVYTAKKN